MKCTTAPRQMISNLELLTPTTSAFRADMVDQLFPELQAVVRCLKTVMSKHQRYSLLRYNVIHSAKFGPREQSRLLLC